MIEFHSNQIIDTLNLQKAVSISLYNYQENDIPLYKMRFKGKYYGPDDMASTKPDMKRNITNEKIFLSTKQNIEKCEKHKKMVKLPNKQGNSI